MNSLGPSIASIVTDPFWQRRGVDRGLGMGKW